MAKSLSGTRANLVVGCRATLGAVLTMAIACAQPEPTAPTRQPAILPTAATATANGQGPQACVPDSKLIGRFTASTADFVHHRTHDLAGFLTSARLKEA